MDRSLVTIAGGRGLTKPIQLFAGPIPICGKRRAKFVSFVRGIAAIERIVNRFERLSPSSKRVAMPVAEVSLFVASGRVAMVKLHRWSRHVHPPPLKGNVYEQHRIFRRLQGNAPIAGHAHGRRAQQKIGRAHV